MADNITDLLSNLNLSDRTVCDEIRDFIATNDNLGPNEKAEITWKLLPILLTYIKTHAVRGPQGQQGCMGPRGAYGPPGPKCECNCIPDIKEPGCD